MEKELDSLWVFARGCSFPFLGLLHLGDDAVITVEFKPIPVEDTEESVVFTYTTVYVKMRQGKKILNAIRKNKNEFEKLKAEKGVIVYRLLKYPLTFVLGRIEDVDIAF